MRKALFLLMALALVFGYAQIAVPGALAQDPTGTPAPEETETPGPGTIAEVLAQPIQGADDTEYTFNLLLAAVGAADPAVLELLSNPEAQLTVFAPTDAAIEALPQELLGVLLSSPPSITAILQYHVVDGVVKAEDVAALFTEEVTEPTAKTLFVTMDEKETFITFAKNEEGNIVIKTLSLASMPPAEATAKLLVTDVPASNGVIHVVDAILLSADVAGPMMGGPGPEMTPEATMEMTPEATMEMTPEMTPEATMEMTPEMTPEATEGFEAAGTPEATPEVTVEPTVETTPETTPEPTVEPTVEATPETTPEPTVEATPETTPEPTVEATPEVTVEPTVEATEAPVLAEAAAYQVKGSGFEFTLQAPNGFAQVTNEEFFVLPVTIFASTEDIANSYLSTPEAVTDFVIIFTTFTTADLPTLGLDAGASLEDIRVALTRPGSVGEPITVTVGGVEALQVEFTNAETGKSGVYQLIPFPGKEGATNYLLIQGSSGADAWAANAELYAQVVASIAQAATE